MRLVNSLKNLVLAENLIYLSALFSDHFGTNFAITTITDYESSKKFLED